MPSTPKRPLASSIRAISPPAIRRKISEPPLDSEEKRPVNPSHIRIYSWNVNGIGPLLQKRLDFSPEACFPLRSFLKRHQWPTFLCLQEVKISSTDDGTKRRLQQAANVGKQPHEPSYATHFSLPRDRYNATGFGGKVHGVATLVRNDVACQILENTRKPDWDLEGRVLIHELHDNLVIVNGYWVNGTSNPYRNSISGVVEGTRHDHKLCFHQHMLDEALNLISIGKCLILVGDMNVARCQLDGHPRLRTSPDQHVRNRADFNRKFFEDRNGLRAVDVFRRFHGETRKYTYHPRSCNWGESCDRVDLIISDPTLVDSNAVVATDICDNAQDRGHSDHVPLWVEINLDRLRGISSQLGVGRDGTDISDD